MAKNINYTLHMYDCVCRYISIDHLVLWGWGIFSLGLCVYRNPWLDIKSSQHVYRASGRQDQITKPFRALSGGKSSGEGGGEDQAIVGGCPTTHHPPCTTHSSVRITSNGLSVCCRFINSVHVQPTETKQEWPKGSEIRDWGMGNGEWRADDISTFPFE